MIIENFFNDNWLDITYIFIEDFIPIKLDSINIENNIISVIIIDNDNKYIKLGILVEGINIKAIKLNQFFIPVYSKQYRLLQNKINKYVRMSNIKDILK